MKCTRLFAVLLIIVNVVSFTPFNHNTIHHNILPDGRIVYGTPISIEDAPYQVSLERMNQHACGGSLIHPKLVLTAAHCTDFVRDPNNVKTEELVVRAGTNEAGKGGSRYSVRRVEISPLFTQSPDFGDIALIYLSTTVQLSDRIRPIAMAQETPLVGQKSYVTGYGSQRIQKAAKQIFQGPYKDMNRLMAVELPVFPKSTCFSIMQRLGVTVSDDQICAGYASDHRDACHGDSGGPMVVNNKLAGIIVWGIGCGQKGLPGVYTDVAYHKEWLTQCTKRLLKRGVCSRHHPKTDYRLLIRLPNRRSRRHRGIQRWTGKARSQRMRRRVKIRHNK